MHMQAANVDRCKTGQEGIDQLGADVLKQGGNPEFRCPDGTPFFCVLSA